MAIQTRSESTGLKYHTSVSDAFRYAEANPTVWKISFDSEDGERVRLISCEEGTWRYQDPSLMFSILGEEEEE